MASRTSSPRETLSLGGGGRGPGRGHRGRGGAGTPYDTPRAAIVSSRRALALIGAVRAAGAANIAFLADLYHLSRMGEDLAGTLARYASDIAHIQVADVPGLVVHREPASWTMSRCSGSSPTKATRAGSAASTRRQIRPPALPASAGGGTAPPQGVR